MQDEKEKLAEISLNKPRKAGNPFTSEKAKEYRAKQGPRSKGKKTLLKEEVWRSVEQKLMERSLKLVDTQSILAHGSIKIYKITSHFEGSGKNRKKVRDKPKLVTNDSEIEKVLDYEYGDGEDPNDENEYFFVTTQDPDNRAIKDQLDRIGLKTPDKVEHSGKIDIVKQIVIEDPNANN